MKNLTGVLYKIRLFLPIVGTAGEQCPALLCIRGVLSEAELWVTSAYSETSVAWEIPILSWQCCRWSHRWRLYARCIFLPNFRFFICLGAWTVNHMWQKNEEVNYMMILNLALLQVSKKNTELLENCFKIWKCQYYAHDLNYFSQWRRNMVMCSNLFSLFGELI